MPYIMPDGSRLSRYLAGADGGDGDDAKANAAARRRKQKKGGGGGGGRSGGGGREAMWSLLQQQVHNHHSHSHAHSHHDPELAALERAGRARARRMLNDRVLRDLADADALSAADMASLFSPAPFGGPVRPGPFAAVTGGGRGGRGSSGGGSAADAWDAFRNIDMDKQQRLLEGWAAAVAASRREARAQRRAEAAGRRRRAQEEEAGGEDAQQSREGGINSAAEDARRRREARAAAAAAAALASWARVPRGARVALRRANVHAVLDLESDLLTRLEEQDRESGAAAAAAVTTTTAATVVIARHADGFGRLLAHGIAAFHGLSSASCDVARDEDPEAEEEAEAVSGSGRGVSVWRVVAGEAEGAQQQQVAAAAEAMAGAAGEAGAEGASPPANDDADDDESQVVTCTDLLMAMQEGAYLTAASVARYARAHLILSGATTPRR